MESIAGGEPETEQSLTCSRGRKPQAPGGGSSHLQRSQKNCRRLGHLSLPGWRGSSTECSSCCLTHAACCHTPQNAPSHCSIGSRRVCWLHTQRTCKNIKIKY